MIELNVAQGSSEWHAARAKCFNASEAPAMMGVSNYMTRSGLIKQKVTGITPEIDAATQRRFDDGHRVEALARPLAEAIIGEELFPIVATDDEGRLLASSDGATMLCNIGFEHKLWNQDIAAQVEEGNVPDSHKWQLDQQIAVFGFDRIMFVCSDGTPDNFVYCWYTTTPERITQLYAGWDQFEKDMATYVHEEVKPTLVAESAKDLPAVIVQVSGSVSIVDNFSLFEIALRDFVENKLVRSPQTDQDFVDLDQQIKSLKKAEDALDAAEEQMIAQVASVDSMKRTKNMLHKLARDNRLIAERLLKAEKESRKGEIVTKARHDLVEHVDTLHKRLGFACISIDSGIFAAAISGLKSLDSMRDKVSVVLANAKIEANAVSDRFWLNRITVEDMSLFPDFNQVCTKLPEDFAALMAMRIGQRQALLDAEREKIRVEEQAKAQREAEAKARAEAQAEAAKEEIQRLAYQKAQPAVEMFEAMGVKVVDATPANDHIGEATKMVDTGKTIKLGEICGRLGFTMTADFLSQLGFDPAATDKNAKLYREASFPAICRAIAKHVTDVATGTVRLAA